MRPAKYLVSLLALISLSACAGTPPNIPLCTELAPDRAYCVKIMTGEHFDVNEKSKLNGKTWWEQKPSVISMPATSWRELKRWIIKICKGNSQCDSRVASWERTIEIIDEQVTSKESP